MAITDREGSGVQGLIAALVGAGAGSRDNGPILKWVLVNALAGFGFLVLWHFGLVQAMLATDHTRISLVILGIFVVTALHCLYQTIQISRELAVARRVRDAVDESGGRGLQVIGERVMTADGRELDPGILTGHIANLFEKARQHGGSHIDQTLLLRSLSDQLRSREKLGLFIAEALLRLALLGTAVGFILMLIPIAGLDNFDSESLRQALTGMSGGMAIALNVTVTGIASALLLKFEYYLLDEAIADLFHMTTEVTEVHVVPSLEKAADAARS